MNENPDLYNESYVLYDRVMNPLAAQLERKTKKNRGMRRGRHSTSSSTFNQPSSSHLNDDDDENDEGTSRASTHSPIRYVNSLTNEVPQVFQNPPNIDPHLEPFYTRHLTLLKNLFKFLTYLVRVLVSSLIGVPSDGPYQTNLPSLDDIISTIQIDREGQVRRIRHEEEIAVHEYQILTREILSILKPLEEIIQENIFCLGVIGTMFPRVFVTCFIVLYTLKSSTLLITWQNEWSGSLNKRG
nr:hypothetical protein [Tanacetum cinerariifolium]